MTMISMRMLVGIFFAATSIGCTTMRTSPPVSNHGSAIFLQHAADVLASGVQYTRSSSREVAGWCWSDKATGRLSYVAQSGVGEYEGVGVSLPIDPRGTGFVSCSWHTHPWGSYVAPGPSKRDLQNSMLPWVSGMTHFVVDQHGIWQYTAGRVVEMCPWNSDGTTFDTARCRL
jgi:hypothetical protein